MIGRRPAIALLVLGGLAVVIFIVRPGARRPIVAIGTFGAAGFVGLVMILAALFSDFSGRHEIRWEWLAIGVIVVTGGLFVSIRIARSTRHRPARPPQPSASGRRPGRGRLPPRGRQAPGRGKRGWTNGAAGSRSRLTWTGLPRRITPRIERTIWSAASPATSTIEN
ncbi:MAG TPA: hypothetical protein VK194_02335, partial [Candidatus Deferrimicrobium sp.]|nr:hypothetical protein [Candidatus Deferrimicrobium sp.]